MTIACRLHLASGAALALAAALGCEAPIEFPDAVDPCVKTLTGDIVVPTQRAADILIVVDNSASMLEEQTNLAVNFNNPNPGVSTNSPPGCPLQDLTNIPAEFRNPAPPLYTGSGPLAACGFVQLVAAFDNDFRVGVVTTDVGLCDNRVPSAQGGDAWGFRPQRGCLQPDAAPGASGAKVIARADLVDADAANDDLAARFSDTLANIQTYGTPMERGLDAMQLFLDPTSDRHPDCAGDLSLFRRDDAQLVVIFLTDEEDCSHGLAGALESFGNENAGEVCGEFPDHFLQVPASRCYSNPELLSPVQPYVDALLAADPEAKVAVIAGGIGDAGEITPAGCLVGGDGLPTGGADVCFSSGGLSNRTGANEPCGPDTAAARGGLPCCVADSGSRYYELADIVGRSATDSICNSSFRASMLDIAAFIAAVDSVRLAEPPDSPDAILVELRRAGSDESEVLPRVPDGADCTTETGWRLEDEDLVVFCGAARPGPGDVVSVRARGDSDPADGGPDACNAPKLEASGGGSYCGAGGAAAPLALLALVALMRRRSMWTVAR